MKKSLVFFALVFLTFVFVAPSWGASGIFINRTAVRRFATMPSGVSFPEGITANPANGDIYVSTFSFGPSNKLLRFNKSGILLASKDFGVTPLLGLAFNPADGKVYICNAGNLVGSPSQIQRIAADFDGLTSVEDVAVIPPAGAPGDRTVDNPDGS
jgi:DNA-binding beta-propeller fold protein YncE